MLSTELKAAIQSSYRRFLQARELRPRHGQKLMIAAIANTLGGIQLNGDGQRDSQHHICVIEAGTGTGKTVAYFLAAIPIAKALGKHLVVSTATVALQEQIVYKDLPELKRHCELPVSFALAKGRGRYLCLAKLDRQLKEFQSPQSLDLGVPQAEMPSDESTIKLYHSMMDALSANDWDGDRDNWKTMIEDSQWRPVTANHRECSGRRCSYVSSCSFFRARENLNGVDCVVTNHDLVLSDLALGGGAILPAPEDTLYIFDEGHHLPEKALSHFANYSRLESTQKWFDECTQSFSSAASQIGEAGNIQRWLTQLPEQFDNCKKLIAAIQPVLLDLFDEERRDERHPQRYRFERGEVPETVRELAAELATGFSRVAEAFSQIHDDMADGLEDAFCPVPKVDLENWFPVIGTWLARAETNYALWHSYATPDDGDLPQARWLEKLDTTAGLELALSSSPILAASTLNELLWQRCCGAVVTSATLTALGRFDRLMMRSGVPADSCFEVVPSPFDYSRVALQIPPQASDAGDAATHTQTLIDALPELLNENEGSLVLFASRRQMRDVFDQLPAPWRERILLQDERPKQEILAEHKHRLDRDEGSVIFGLASFAEGVDLPGAYCSHVVVAKIPFSVPDEPVEAALAEWIKARGGNPFMEISVPDASLKLIQACGRLIRTESDTGRVTLMDRRLLTRQYGKAMLAALPPFSRA